MARSLHLSLNMARRARGRRAFTLIELMIVVVIVGILAVLAVVGYRRIVTSAHMSEATNMIQSIRTAQEAYHAETQAYVSTSASPFTNLYPNAAPTNVKTGWGAGIAGPCTPYTPSPNCWSALPLHVDSAVMYGYATTAGQAGTPGTVSVAPSSLAVTFPAGNSPTDWYYIGAVGDVDGNGTFSYVLGSSFTNDLFTQAEGE